MSAARTRNSEAAVCEIDPVAIIYGMDIPYHRLNSRDAGALAAFYNALSPASKRTFRPLGETATVRICAKVARENLAERKYDLVAKEDGSIVGWGFLWDLKSECSTLGLGIADGWQGKGLGRAFMDALISEARCRQLGQVTLTVVQDNERAIRLYEQYGFVRRDEFVADDGLPYYRMTVTLEPT